jgi:hypothetical protein
MPAYRDSFNDALLEPVSYLRQRFDGPNARQKLTAFTQSTDNGENA